MFVYIVFVCSMASLYLFTRCLYFDDPAPILMTFDETLPDGYSLGKLSSLMEHLSCLSSHFHF